MAVVPAAGGTALMSTTAAAVWSAVGTPSLGLPPTDSPLASAVAQSAQPSDPFGFMSDIVYVNADNIGTVFDTPPTQPTAAPSVSDKYPAARAPPTPKEPLSKGSIIAIGVGAAFAAILVAGIIFASMYNRAQRKRAGNEDHDVEGGNPDMDGKALGADEEDAGTPDKDDPARGADDKVEAGDGAAPVENTTAGELASDSTAGRDPYAALGDTNLPTAMVNDGSYQNNLEADSQPPCDPYATLGNTNVPADMVDNGAYKNNLEVNQPPCADAYAALADANIPASMVQEWHTNLDIEAPTTVVGRPAPGQWAPLEPYSEGEISDASPAPIADTVSATNKGNSATKTASDLPVQLGLILKRASKLKIIGTIGDLPGVLQHAGPAAIAAPIMTTADTAISAPTTTTADTAISAPITATTVSAPNADTSAEAAVPNLPNALGITFQRAAKPTMIRNIAELATVLQRVDSDVTSAPITDTTVSSCVNADTAVNKPTPSLPFKLGTPLQRSSKIKIIRDISELAEVLEHASSSTPDLEYDVDNAPSPLSAVPTEVGTPEITHSLFTVPSSTNLRTPRTASPSGSGKASLDDSFRAWRFPLSPTPPSEIPPQTPTIDSGHAIATAGDSLATPAPDEGVDTVPGGGALKRRGAIRIFSRRPKPTAEGGATTPSSPE